MWLAHLSYSQKQVQLRHRSSIRTMVYIKAGASALVRYGLHSPHSRRTTYIYTHWRRSVPLLGFAYSLSLTLFTRSKQDCVGLLSLSPPSQLVKEASVSRHTGKGRRCSVHSIAFGEGGNPLPAALFFHPAPVREGHRPFFLAVVRSVGRFDLPPHALPHPDDPKV